MLVFEQRGKPEYPRKNVSEQSRESTNSTHIWRRIRESILGHFGGRRVLSPLRQHSNVFLFFLSSLTHYQAEFALVTRRPYCPGRPKQLCFTTPSLTPIVSTARRGKTKLFWSPGTIWPPCDKGEYLIFRKWHIGRSGKYHDTLCLSTQIWVVSYLIERASGLAKRTIERAKITRCVSCWHGILLCHSPVIDRTKHQENRNFNGPRMNNIRTPHTFVSQFCLSLLSTAMPSV